MTSKSKSPDSTAAKNATPAKNVQGIETPRTDEVRAATIKATVPLTPAMARDLPTGTELTDRYEILSKIGEGSMGTVYRAYDRTLRTEIAIKAIFEQSPDQTFEEVKLGHNVSHPNVCRIYDVGKADELLFISMEYIDGRTISELLEYSSLLPQKVVANIGYQVCIGLDAIHRARILHRDLKPGNLILTKERQIKVMDFGVAAPRDKIHGRQIVGALAYLAPEVWSKPNAASPQSDIYALGLILYHLLTGHPGCLAGTIEEYYRLHQQEVPPLPSTLADNINPGIESIIMRCIAKAPEMRPADVMEVADVLAKESMISTASRTQEIAIGIEDGVVAAVDLSRYGDLAKTAWDLFDDGAVARLDKQIRSLIEDTLKSIKVNPSSLRTKRVGDGQITLFKNADIAHQFGVALHQRSEQFKPAHQQPHLVHGQHRLHSRRCFRIGIASGDIVLTEDDMSGLAIMRAVRLEGQCRTGEIIIDRKTWEELSKDFCELYSDERIIPGKRDERFPARLLRVIEPAPWDRADVILACGFFVPDHTTGDEDASAGTSEDFRPENDETIQLLVKRYGGKLSKTRNGLRFYRAWDAICFALDYRDALSKSSQKSDTELHARFGIHQLESENKEQIFIDPEDTATQIATQIMICNGESRILLTGPAFDHARSEASEEEIGRRLQWLNYGYYRLEGRDEPIQICEVGCESDVSSRPGTATVQPLDGQVGKGPWIPAPDQEVPEADGWILEKKLGEGGFGEAWLATKKEGQSGGAQHCVFKFCRKEVDLESLKREKAIFELMKEKLKGRNDITRIIGWRFDRTPYYIQFKYAEYGNLIQWAKSRNGLENVPFDVRLKIARQIAEALDAAHSFGIIHCDIKPSNVLVIQDAKPCPRVQITDFGVGKISAKLYHEQIDTIRITSGGERLHSWTTSTSATWLYSAPEVLEGRQETTTQSDVYALGVLLYQLAVGDFARTLLPGWQKDIRNERLFRDIARMVMRSPEHRPSAGQVAQWIINFKDRETKLEQRKAEEERQKAKSERRKAFVFLGLFLFAAAAGLLATYMSVKAKRAAGDARAALIFLVDLFKIADPADTSDPGQPRGEDVTTGEILNLSSKRLETELKDQPRVRAPVINAVGDIYRSLGRYDRAEPLIEEALRLRLKEFGKNSLAAAESLNTKGMLSEARNDYTAAEELFKDALEIRRRRAGNESAEVAESLNNLAAVLAERGDYEAAAQYSREALEIRRRIVDREQTNVARTEMASDMNDLALILWDKSDYEEAEQLLRQALEIQREVLRDHPHTAATMNNLAFLLLEFGADFEEPERLLRRTLDMRRSFYIGEHPDIAESLNNLGTLFHYMGKYEQAEEYFEKALEMQQHIFGVDQNLGEAATLVSLALMNEERGQYKVAEARYRQALSTQRNLLGAKHRTVALTTTYLAGCLEDMGRYDDADQMYRNALEIQRQVMVEKSLDRATTLNLHGLLLMNRGRYPEAYKNFCEALDIRRDIFSDEERFEVAEIKNNLAMLLDSTGRFWKAELLYRDALAVMKNEFGDFHPYIADVENNLAFVLIQKGEVLNDTDDAYDATQTFKSAVELFNHAMEINRASFGDESPGVARTLKNLGFLFELRDDYEQAERYYRQALDLRKKLLGEEHPDVAKVLSNMARMNVSRGDVDTGQSLISEALEIFQISIPEQWHIANAQSILGSCLTERGAYGEAENLLLGSYPILREKKGASSFYSRDALKRLIRLYDAWGRPEDAQEYRGLHEEALSRVNDGDSDRYPEYGNVCF